MATLEIRGRGVRVPLGDRRNLLVALRHAKIPLGQSCGGRGVCRSCDVEILHGGPWLSSPTDAERAWRLPDGSRLACQVQVKADAPADARIVLWHPGWGARDRGAQTACTPPSDGDPGC